MAGILTNPIAYAHVQTRGGVLKQFAYAGIYLVVVGAFITLTSYSKGRWMHDILAGWMYTLMVLQTGSAMLFASSRITASIRRDLQDEMIDSLRLMPLPASQAVLGYIFAGGLQAGAIMAANLLMGLVIAVPAGFTIEQWVTANFILLFFSMFVLVIVAMLSFQMKAAAMLVFAVLSATSVMQGVPAMILPGLAVLLTPLMGRSIYSMRNLFSDLGPQLAIATVAHTAIGSVCFVAACRKFRRSDAPAFTSTLGILLLLAWQGTTLLGFFQYEQIRPRFFGMPRMDAEAKVIASFLAAMLLSLLPLLGAVRERLAPAGKSARFSLPPTVVALFCAAICMLILIYRPDFIRGSDLNRAAGLTALLIALFLICIASLARLLLPVPRKGGWILTGILFVLLVIPLAADGLRSAYFPETGESLTALGAFSPIGFLIVLWNRMDAGVLIPLAFYAGMALLLMALSSRKTTAKLSLPNAIG